MRRISDRNQASILALEAGGKSCDGTAGPQPKPMVPKQSPGHRCNRRRPRHGLLVPAYRLDRFSGEGLLRKESCIGEGLRKIERGLVGRRKAASFE